MPVQAAAYQPHVVDRAQVARLQVRQLEGVPQPVEDVVDGKLQQQAHRPLAIAAWRTALACGGRARRAQEIAGLAFALARAHAVARRRQAKMRMFEQAHGHLHRTLLRSADQVRRGDQFGQVRLHGIAYFLVVTQPVARAAREQTVPGLGQGWGGGHWRSRGGHGYSCASKVVT